MTSSANAELASTHARARRCVIVAIGRSPKKSAPPPTATMSDVVASTATATTNSAVRFSSATDAWARLSIMPAAWAVSEVAVSWSAPSRSSDCRAHPAWTNESMLLDRAPRMTPETSWAVTRATSWCTTRVTKPSVTARTSNVPFDTVSSMRGIRACPRSSSAIDSATRTTSTSTPASAKPAATDPTIRSPNVRRRRGTNGVSDWNGVVIIEACWSPVEATS